MVVVVEEEEEEEEEEEGSLFFLQQFFDESFIACVSLSQFYCVCGIPQNVLFMKSHYSVLK